MIHALEKIACDGKRFGGKYGRNTDEYDPRALNRPNGRENGHAR